MLFYTPGDFGPDRVVVLAAVGTVTECVVVQPASNDQDDPDRLPGYFASIRVAYWHADLPGPNVLAA